MPGIQGAARSGARIGGFQIVLAVLAPVVLAAGSEPVTLSTSATLASRPARWAQPLKRPGLPNLHKVSDRLYRAAQPTAGGMRELKRMGVTTVVNLRSFHSDRDEIGDTGLAYEHIYMKTWHPEDEEIVRFLQIVSDPRRAPVFVHCQHGSDRTGLMCAIHRVAIEGWSKDDAIAEMTGGGFGFYPGWQNLIDYLHELDVERIARRAGISAAAPRPARPAAIDAVTSAGASRPILAP